jgi:hypothetical protein
MFAGTIPDEFFFFFFAVVLILPARKANSLTIICEPII